MDRVVMTMPDPLNDPLYAVWFARTLIMSAGSVLGDMPPECVSSLVSYLKSKGYTPPVHP